MEDSGQWMGYVSSNVHTNQLLVWDPLEDPAAILTMDEVTTRWQDEYQGRFLRFDEQTNTIAPWTSITTPGTRRALRAMTLHVRVLQKMDEDYMIDDWEKIGTRGQHAGPGGSPAGRWRSSIHFYTSESVKLRPVWVKEWLVRLFKGHREMHL